MKRCFKCERLLPPTEFYRHPSMADRLLGKCKACTCRDVRENRAARRDHYREFDRQRSSHPGRVKARADYAASDRGREVHRKACRKYYREHGNPSTIVWQESHPDRRAAQNAVAYALRTGRLKAEPCAECGAKAHAHHPDYSRPLNVVWLCPLHHARAHKQMRDRGETLR